MIISLLMLRTVTTTTAYYLKKRNATYIQYSKMGISNYGLWKCTPTSWDGTGTWLQGIGMKREKGDRCTPKY